MPGTARRARRAPWMLALLFLLPTCGSGTTPPPGPDPQPAPTADPIPIGLVPVAAGIPSPLLLTHAGDGSGRRFVVSQTGQIRVIDATGTLLPTPFLDLGAQLVVLDGTFDERGLLGLAFHPQYATNGRFFVRYGAPRAGVMGEPCFGTTRGCHTEVLSEFAVLGDPLTSNVADAGSERVLFTIDEPEFNHDGGHVAFGPDGYLYFALGDGGGANDGLHVMPPAHGPIGNGQDVDTVLGAMLRIDVDSPPPVGSEYVVPPTNPFALGPGADEIFAYGLRNPYRFSFDDAPGGTNALYVADVGQRLFEELNVVALGGNYGWAGREGFVCFDPLAPEVPPPACSTTGPLGEPLLDPVLVYDHDVGLAIVGGYVYRGASVPALTGRYVFGDWSNSFGDPNGQLFATDVAGPLAFQRRALQIMPGNVALGLVVLGFGRDEAGELYVLGSNVSAPGGMGSVQRIVPAP